MGNDQVLVPGEIHNAVLLARDPTLLGKLPRIGDEAYPGVSRLHFHPDVLRSADQQLDLLPGRFIEIAHTGHERLQPLPALAIGDNPKRKPPRAGGPFRRARIPDRQLGRSIFTREFQERSHPAPLEQLVLQGKDRTQRRIRHPDNQNAAGSEQTQRLVDHHRPRLHPAEVGLHQINQIVGLVRLRRHPEVAGGIQQARISLKARERRHPPHPQDPGPARDKRLQIETRRAHGRFALLLPDELRQAFAAINPLAEVDRLVQSSRLRGLLREGTLHHAEARDNPLHLGEFGVRHQTVRRGMPKVLTIIQLNATELQFLFRDPPIHVPPAEEDVKLLRRMVVRFERVQPEAQRLQPDQDGMDIVRLTVVEPRLERRRNFQHPRLDPREMLAQRLQDLEVHALRVDLDETNARGALDLGDAVQADHGHLDAAIEIKILPPLPVLVAVDLGLVETQEARDPAVVMRRNMKIRSARHLVGRERQQGHIIQLSLGQLRRDRVAQFRNRFKGEDQDAGVARGNFKREAPLVRANVDHEVSDRSGNHGMGADARVRGRWV